MTWQVEIGNTHQAANVEDQSHSFAVRYGAGTAEQLHDKGGLIGKRN